MELTVENLERAVSQFYHTDSTQQAQAHQWLTAVQSSTSAWAIVWQLLDPNRTPEVQFFAATTLHMKLMKNWLEVPTEDYAMLKNRLLEAIVQYSSGPKIVLNRLCIALSAYLIQTTPDYWPNSLTEVIAMFSPENLPGVAPPEKVMWILLEVLIVIPEEFQTMTLGHKDKQRIKKELEKSIHQVFTVIERTLTLLQDNRELMGHGIKALMAWLQFDVPCNLLMPLAQCIVQYILNNTSMSCEMETEALGEICTHAYMRDFVNPARMQAQQVDTFLMLRPLLENPSRVENKELIVNVYKALASIAEYYGSQVLQWMIQGEARGFQVVRLMLDCTSTPGAFPMDETVSQATFGFWYILQDHMPILAKEKMVAAKTLLVPVYRELVTILLKKSQFPDRPMEFSSSELFRCYRQDIADTMVYCYQVLGKELIETLSSLVNSPSSGWREVESGLAAALAVAQSPNDDLELLQLLVTVPESHLNKNHRVVNTYNQAIGAYADFISGQTEALDRLIPRLAMSLQVVETSASATMALKDITRECTISLRPYAPRLLSSCQEALSKGHLRQKECIRLMYSFGRLMSILNYDEMMRMLEPMALDYTTTIQALLAQPASGATKSALALRLRMMGTLLSTLYLEDSSSSSSIIAASVAASQQQQQQPPPALHLLNHLLPVFALVVQKWCPDLTILQEVCTCLKNSVTGLLDKCESLLPSILALIVTCYNSQPNPAALEAAKQVVLLFGGGAGSSAQSSSSCEEMLVSLIRSLTERTLELAYYSGPTPATTSGDSYSPLQQNCDIVQSFLDMTASLVKKQSKLYVVAASTAASVTSPDIQQQQQRTLLSSVFNFAKGCLVLPEAQTVKEAEFCLVNIIIQGMEMSQIDVVVEENGANLVYTIVRCIAGVSPRSCLEPMAHILLQLNKRNPTSLSRWLPQALTTVTEEQLDGSTPFSRVTPAQKHQFTRDVLRQRRSRMNMNGIVRDFAFICRGLISVVSSTTTTSGSVPGVAPQASSMMMVI